MLTHSEDDARIAEAQLGRPLRGRWAVARRCHLGLPMVIEDHPRLEDGSPFPTLFWLTCPVLVGRVSRLEAAGAMAAVTRRLGASDLLRARLGDALARYRARRDSHEVIDDSGAPPGGGPDRVKCLHAHAAHELADPPNPVGAIALASTAFPDCATPCVVREGAGR
jgi:hypothetical protein